MSVSPIYARWGDRQFAIKPTIGAAISPNDGFSGDELTTKADAAMYRVEKTLALQCAFRPTGDGHVRDAPRGTEGVYEWMDLASFAKGKAASASC